MATFSQLKQRVERRVIDLPTAVQTEVPLLVNSAYRHLQRKHNFKVMETQTSTLVTTVGERVLAAVPSDFKELREFPYRITRLGDHQRMKTQLELAELGLRFGDQDEGVPQAVLLGEQDTAGVGDLEVWPLPDGDSDHVDGEYRIVVPYYRFLPALVNDADTNWLVVNGEDYIVMKATSDAFAVDWDEERMTIWRQLAQNELREVIRADKRAQVAGIEALAVHWRGAKQVGTR